MRSATRYLWLAPLAAIICAVMVTLSCRPAAPVAAAVVVGNACTAEYSDVDYTVTGANRRSDTTVHTVIEGRRDGDSIHEVRRYKDQPPGYEQIWVDRRLYTRETGQDGQWGPWEELEVLTPPPSSSTRSDEDTTSKSIDPPTSTFCGGWDPSDVQFLGTVTIGDGNTSVRHYIAATDYAGRGLLPGTFENWEFWVDLSGTLLQVRQEYYSPAIQSYPLQHLDVTTTFSGHGEANVITAPIVP